MVRDWVSSAGGAVTPSAFFLGQAYFSTTWWGDGVRVRGQGSEAYFSTTW